MPLLHCGIDILINKVYKCDKLEYKCKLQM